jgi:hypothetical protein
MRDFTHIPPGDCYRVREDPLSSSPVLPLDMVLVNEPLLVNPIFAVISEPSP